MLAVEIPRSPDGDFLPELARSAEIPDGGGDDLMEKFARWAAQMIREEQERGREKSKSH